MAPFLGFLAMYLSTASFGTDFSSTVLHAVHGAELTANVACFDATAADPLTDCLAKAKIMFRSIKKQHVGEQYSGGDGGY